MTSLRLKNEFASSINIRVIRGKVGSQNFAFSAADTKSIRISGLPEQEKAFLTLEISPFGDSANRSEWFHRQLDITRWKLVPSAAEKALFYRGF
jgi:hypothetical protein